MPKLLLWAKFPVGMLLSKLEGNSSSIQPPSTAFNIRRVKKKSPYIYTYMYMYIFFSLKIILKAKLGSRERKIKCSYTGWVNTSLSFPCELQSSKYLGHLLLFLSER